MLSHWCLVWFTTFSSDHTFVNHPCKEVWPVWVLLNAEVYYISHSLIPPVSEGRSDFWYCCQLETTS